MNIKRRENFALGLNKVLTDHVFDINNING